MRNLAAALAAASIGSACAEPAAPIPQCGLYAYRADIVRVIDGDTVEADIDLGFNTWRRGERLRLARIDAPEKGEPGHREALDALRSMIGEGRGLIICTIKAARSNAEQRGGFGRYLVEIYAGPELANVNDALLAGGFAQPYRPD